MYDDENSQPGVGGDVAPFRIYRAEVASDPATLNDDLMVTISQIDGDDPRGVHDHGPCLGWDKRSDGSLPSSGDHAAVFVDDVGDYWIVNWSPS